MLKLNLVINQPKQILSIMQIKNIIRSFSLVEVKSGHTIKYYYDQSSKRCKYAVCINENSNQAYVNVSYLSNREHLKGKLSKRNYVDILFYTEGELRDLLKEVIKSFN